MFFFILANSTDPDVMPQLNLFGISNESLLLVKVLNVGFQPITGLDNRILCQYLK